MNRYVFLNKIKITWADAFKSPLDVPDTKMNENDILRFWPIKWSIVGDWPNELFFNGDFYLVECALCYLFSLEANNMEM